MREKKQLLVQGCIVVLILSWVIPGYGGIPSEQLKEKTDEIRNILNDPALQNKKGERKEVIMNIVDTMVDWQEATKRALGVHWRKRTPQERDEFTSLFKDLLKRTYSDKLELYSGEEIVYESERVEEDYAVAKSKIINKKKGTDVSVDFRMLKKGEKWLIYDLSIEGISVLNNYRDQFDEIIVGSSYEDLVKKMKNKQMKNQMSSKTSKDTEQ